MQSVEEEKRNIEVLCRFRPLLQNEVPYGNANVASFTSSKSLTFSSKTEKKNYDFNFDRVFTSQATQEDIYNRGVKHVVDNVLDGFNGTVLAYGQTGSGKTHTMLGDLNFPDEQLTEQTGIIPRAICHIFQHIKHPPANIKFTVQISMVEIYQEKINDLLETTRKDLKVRGDPTKGLFIENLYDEFVEIGTEALNLMKKGASHRTTAATNMNQHSSRSHCLFIMKINQINMETFESKTGKLFFVDLAGSEKVSKSGATGVNLQEAKVINQSLSTLGMVISALSNDKGAFVPYRESKLTRVLQDSLGGNSKTTLVITCSPSIYNECETLSTLRFGERAKKVKNNAVINKVITVAELQRVVNSLTSQLNNANERINQLERILKEHNVEIPEAESEFKLDSHQRLKEENEYNIQMIEFHKQVYDQDPKYLMDKFAKLKKLVIEGEDLDTLRNRIVGCIESVVSVYQIERTEQISQIKKLKETITGQTEKVNNASNFFSQFKQAMDSAKDIFPNAQTGCKRSFKQFKTK